MLHLTKWMHYYVHLTVNVNLCKRYELWWLMYHNFTYRCKLPGYSNDTFANQSADHGHLVDMWIPPNSDGRHQYDQCNIFTYEESGNRSGTAKCFEWVYDESVYLKTFSTMVLFILLISSSEWSNAVYSFNNN